MKYPEKVKERLLSKIVVVNDCWEWQACKNKGYGRINVSGKIKEAHRVSYEIFIGEIPKRNIIHHVCNNPACINPKHLKPLLQTNHLKEKGHASDVELSKTHCPKGHPYTEGNLVHRANRKTRECAICNRENAKKYYKTKPTGLRTHCPKGHPYWGENLTMKNGKYKRCKQCAREYYHKNKTFKK